MRPEDVPEELVKAGDKAEAAFMDARWGTSPDSEERVRAILAAVLPEYGATVLEEAADVFEWARDDADYAAFQGWLRDRATEKRAAARLREEAVHG